MKYIFSLAVVLITFNSIAQNSSQYSFPLIYSGQIFNQNESIEIKQESFVAPKPKMLNEMNKKMLDDLRNEQQSILKKNDLNYKIDKLSQTLEDSFDGNGINSSRFGIPNDNHLAVSNDGIVFSVQNSVIRVFNPENENYFFRSLNYLMRNNLNFNTERVYDPRILYDPEENRFILFFLAGSTSELTGTVIGFSETAKPEENWNFYFIEGSPYKNDADTSKHRLWSDYPIVSMNKSDIFLTLNLLRDGESWQEGFYESLIWQIDKKSGYNGANELKTIMHNNFTYNDRPLWSICAAMFGQEMTQDSMLFLSVRPSDVDNDTVFLYRIMGKTSENPTVELLPPLITPIKYGLPTSAIQPNISVASPKLQTNDARVLSAYFDKDQLHYVQTSRNFQSLRPNVFHGIIKNPFSENPSTEAYNIDFDNLDIAYPSIAYAFNQNGIPTGLITFSYTSENELPGTAAVQFAYDAHKKSVEYSKIIILKKGEGIINSAIEDDVPDRWGDYTGCQKQYNTLGKMWVSGSYGNDINKDAKTWVASVVIDLETSPNIEDKVVVYPMPGDGELNILFKIEENGTYFVDLVNSNGQVILKSEPINLVEGSSTITISTDQMSNQIYILRLYKDNKIIHRQKVISN